MPVRYRLVPVGLWDSVWFQALSPESRLLWLWAATNRRQEAAGAFEATMGLMAVETGLDQPALARALEGLGGVLTYWPATGWLWVHDFYRLQSAAMNADNLTRAARHQVAELPAEVAAAIVAAIPELNPWSPTGPGPDGPDDGPGDGDLVAPPVPPAPPAVVTAPALSLVASAPQPVARATTAGRSARARAAMTEADRQRVRSHPLYAALVVANGGIGPPTDGDLKHWHGLLSTLAGVGATPEEIAARRARWGAVMGTDRRDGHPILFSVRGLVNNWGRLEGSSHDDDRSAIRRQLVRQAPSRTADPAGAGHARAAR